MPPAVLIPVGLAVAGAVATNVQQKSANKNNQNQQAGQVQNTQDAYAKAQAQLNPWLKSNPMAGSTVARPGAYPSQTGGGAPQGGGPASHGPAAQPGQGGKGRPGCRPALCSRSSRRS